MKNVITIPVKEELINYLSGVNRDVVGRKMVLKKILSTMNINMINHLEHYEKEYYQKYGEYEIAKEEVFEKTIKESEETRTIDKNTTNINWSINFSDKKLEMQLNGEVKLNFLGKVDKGIIEELQIRAVTVSAMQELISEYVAESYDTTTPTYQSYFKKFTIENEKYELLKQDVAKKYVSDNITWKIDFATESIYCEVLK